MIIESTKGAVIRASKPRNPWDAYAALATSTYAGQDVSPESAMALPAVMGGVKLISEHNGAMPLETIDTRAKGGREVVQGGWLAPMLRHAPNEDQSGADLWTMVNAHLILRGNSYLAKIRDDAGIVRELYPIHPANANAYRAADGSVRFRVRIYDGLDFVEVDFTKRDILHIKGPSINDPLVGESVIAHCRHVLGTQSAQIEYQARTYQDGMLVKGALSTTQNLSEDAAMRIKAQWRSAYGGIGNSNEIALLSNGMQFQQVSLSPEDAQFIESMRWGHTQVATMLKLPASRLNGEGTSMTYANMGQDDLLMDKQACMPLRVMIESALNRDPDLFGPLSPWVPRFNESEALRADIETRFRVYEIERRLGTLSVNEIREREDRPGIEGGDDHTPLGGAPSAPAPPA